MSSRPSPRPLRSTMRRTLTLPLGHAGGPLPRVWPIAFAAALALAPQSALHAKTEGPWQEAYARWQSKKGPDSAAQLLRMMQILRGEVQADKVDALLAKVAKNRRLDPTLRDLASYERLALQERRGSLTPTQRDDGYAKLGYLTKVQVLGPFANGSKGALNTPLPPETTPHDPKARFRGKVRNTQLAWRDLDEGGRMPGALLSLDDMLYPNTDALAYLNVWVKVPGLSKASPAMLQMGSGGSYRVLVNGKLAGEAGGERAPHPLQDEMQVQLEPGWNRILIKSSIQSGLWGHYLRLTDVNGAAIPGLLQQAQPPDTEQKDPAGIQAVKLATKGKGGLVARERAKAKSGQRKDLQALFDLYRYSTPFDDHSDELEQLAAKIDAKTQSASSALQWAKVTREPGPRGERLALVLDRKNSARDPESTQRAQAKAHLQLAFRAQGLDQPRRYAEHLESAAKLWPEHPQIALHRIYRQRNQGWEKSALADFAKLSARYPRSTSVQLAYAQALAQDGQYDKALEQIDAIEKIHGPTVPILGAKSQHLLAKGRQQEALEVRRAALGPQPRPGRLIELARLEEASGHRDQAISLFRKALVISPHHDGVHRELAQVLLRGNQREAAIASMQASLDLRPQQPALRDLLEAMGAKGQKGLFGEYGLGLKAVPKAVASAKKSFPKASSVVLKHRYVVRVLENGLSESLDHRQIYIGDKRGIKKQREQGIVYDPELSFVEVKRARVRHADGTVEDIGVPRSYSLTAAGYRMYYDQRQMVVDFPGLKPGDVIDLAFLKRDIAQENYFGRYFGDIRPLRGEAAQLGSEVIYEAPASRKLFFNRPVQQKTLAKSSPKRIKYWIKGPKVGPLLSQSGMPGWTNSLDFVHASTYARWNDVADWYWDLVREQLVADSAIKNAVQDILKGLPKNASVEDKVAAIYHHVVQKTRYVGLEFGIHGYKPYRTPQIYQRRFGDCKDKASLLKVMLKEAGIESYLVLVRTRDQGTLTEKPASLSAFNHAILYVPALDLFLDGTAEFSAFQELPSADRGASVLIVQDGKGGVFKEIPPQTPKHNQMTQRLSLQVAKDGSAKARYQSKVQGDHSSAYRRAYDDETTQSQTLQRQLGANMSGVVVTKLAPIDTDLNGSLALDANLEIPRWSQAQGQGKHSFWLLGAQSELAKARATQSTRRHAFERPAPISQHRSFEVQLPAGSSWVFVPKSRQISGPFGSLDLKVRTQGDRLFVDVDLELLGGLLSVGAFAKYRQFLQELDATLGQRVVYKG